MDSKTRKCNHCNNDFEDSSTRGTEQKYCSVKCRTNAANKRHQEKIINKVKMEYEEKTNNGNIGADIENNRNNNSDESKWKNDFSYSRGNISNNEFLRLLETNYNTKAYSLSFELKNEQLLKENEELKKKVELLELELEDLENEIDQEPEQMGMIGNVMEQFKQDPVNTINFATSLLQNLFKRKTNEVANEEKK
jgi:hypothetical protein